MSLLFCSSFKYINILWFCAHWLAMSNSCYNPFIYVICHVSYCRTLFADNVVILYSSYRGLPKHFSSSKVTSNKGTIFKSSPQPQNPKCYIWVHYYIWVMTFWHFFLLALQDKFKREYRVRFKCCFKHNTTLGNGEGYTNRYISIYIFKPFKKVIKLRHSSTHTQQDFFRKAYEMLLK